MPAGRILYLALADARGHLMRAHLLSQNLARVHLEVSVVTTAREGARFLERLGTRARVLSEHFRVEFNDSHDMSRAKTDRRVLNYLLLPWRGLADLAQLVGLSRGADLLVNDSLHPILLAAPALGFPVPVVQVYGENLWRAMEDNFEGRAAPWVSRRFRQVLRAVRDRAFGRIIHVVGTPSASRFPGQHTYVLPPLVARPSRPRAEVRQALAVPEGKPLAAIYLNPHFRQPAIASGVETALRRRGFHLHAVGEGYASRPGWRATDANFSEVVYAADLFVSGAGMGALELARASGTPLLVLLGDQPEQERNIADVRERSPALLLRAVPLGGADLASAVAEAAGALEAGGAARKLLPLHAQKRLEATESAWRQAFVDLVAAARVRATARLGRRAPARARPVLGPGTP
jgi:hypothetical protein